MARKWRETDNFAEGVGMADSNLLNGLLEPIERSNIFSLMVD